MLTQNTVRPLLQRHYEDEVAAAFAEYQRETPLDTEPEIQADARRRYVERVHSIRRRFHAFYAALREESPAWLPPAEEPVSSLPEPAPAFEVLAVLFIDVEDES